MTTPNADLAVLASRLGAVEEAVQRISAATERIADAMVKLAQLEVHHNETRDQISVLFDKQQALNDRLALIERDMPGLKEVRGWVIAGVLGGVGLMGLALAHLVFK